MLGEVVMALNPEQPKLINEMVKSGLYELPNAAIDAAIRCWISAAGSLKSRAMASKKVSTAVRVGPSTNSWPKRSSRERLAQSPSPR